MNTKIMIIDAHPVYVLKTVGFLESLTLKDTLVVPWGLKAMESIAEYKPDFIILSAALADTDSIELARQIKEQAPSIPIIVQTGVLVNQQTIEAFKSFGVEYVIPRREKDWSAFQEAVTHLVSS